MGKPAFDPTQPFDIVPEDQKPAFDPNKPFTEIPNVSDFKHAPPSPGYSSDPYDWGVTAPDNNEEAQKQFSKNAPGMAANYGAVVAGVPIAEVASPLLRHVLNSGMQAVAGAAEQPKEGESRGQNALQRGVGAFALSNLLSHWSEPLAFGGSKLLGISSDVAQNYAKDPTLAEETFSKFKNNPEDINNELKGMIKDSIYGDNSVFDQKSAPLLQKRGEMLAGKNISVLPEQFQGTKGYDELQRIANLTNPQQQPMSIKYGEPVDQTIPQMYSDIRVPVSEVTTSVGEAPNAPMPQRMSLAGEQAETLKEILADEAEHKAKLYAIGSEPKNETAAIGASNIRKALQNVSPGIEDVNAQLKRNIDLTNAAKDLFSSNPARILNSSESIGNTNVRSLQQFLDENAGTNFEDLSKAFQAGKEINNPVRNHGFLQRSIGDPTGQTMLKSMGAIQRRLGAAGQSIVESPAAAATGSAILNSKLNDMLYGKNRAYIEQLLDQAEQAQRGLSSGQ